MTRADTRKEWAKLSDEQVLELLGIIWGPLFLIEIIDPTNNPNIRKVANDIFAISAPVRMGEDTKVFKNQSDINALKNKIKNKASEEKNLSVAVDVADSYSKDLLKLAKRFYSKNRNQSDVDAIIEDAKGLAKKGISDIRRKLPKFPFNPRVINQYPELFAETPKPSASECKRYFKCSSIYAA